ncbi:hypothetical protein [Bradyrhizobium sp. LHD-71]|uniref:hypothetical protein n=1 Tax=Bradyrhizobium sp. LHD-71 TaxID=3072141 RepID=UPI00280CCFDC|nr:hypothetical protein [Bradyrhizobium sp. LHD-71]MDQ8730021.1 hypothetical protein [Bradyrhizobium sp. LHD-71]
MPKIVGSLLMFLIAALISVAMAVPENIPKQLFVALVWYLAGAMTVFLLTRPSQVDSQTKFSRTD